MEHTSKDTRGATIGREHLGGGDAQAFAAAAVTADAGKSRASRLRAQAQGPVILPPLQQSAHTPFHSAVQQKYEVTDASPLSSGAAAAALSPPRDAPEATMRAASAGGRGPSGKPPKGSVVLPLGPVANHVVVVKRASRGGTIRVIAAVTCAAVLGAVVILALRHADDEFGSGVEVANNGGAGLVCNGTKCNATGTNASSPACNGTGCDGNSSNVGLGCNAAVTCSGHGSCEAPGPALHTCRCDAQYGGPSCSAAATPVNLTVQATGHDAAPNATVLAFELEQLCGEPGTTIEPAAHTLYLGNAVAQVPRRVLTQLGRPVRGARSSFGLGRHLSDTDSGTHEWLAQLRVVETSLNNTAAAARSAVVRALRGVLSTSHPRLQELNITAASVGSSRGEAWPVASFVVRGRDVATPPFRVIRTSPVDGEIGVTLTRETFVVLSRPMTRASVENVTSGRERDALVATALGARLDGTTVVSRDGTTVSLMFHHPLPPNTDVEVAVAPHDALMRSIDPPHLLLESGVTYRFRTLSFQPAPNTSVCGRVMASRLNAVGNASVNMALEGVTITVDGSDEGGVRTNQFGNFVLPNVPAGRFFVHVNGRTAVAVANGSDGSYYPSGTRLSVV